MLKDDMVRQGNWLFRWRSYLPLILLPSAVAVLQGSGWMTQVFGARFEDGYDYFLLLIAFTGFAIRVATVGFVPAGTSGRNTRGQNAAALNTTGFYSLSRHPLYFANFLVFISFVLLLKSLLFTLFAGVIYFLYYERIMLAEEQFLESLYGQAYRVWAAATPAFLPRLSGWVRPSLPFSWRSVIGREFHTVLLIASVFFLSEMLEAIVVERQTFAQWVHEEPVWLWMLCVSGAIYLMVRALKKRTNWLAVAGR
jgi:protein-S-isoprenylcysteine O-methyltransferase Ste14